MTARLAAPHEMTTDMGGTAGDLDGTFAVLRAWLDGKVLPQFAGHILPLDQAVALRCGRLHAPELRAERDAIIAATALVHGMTIVTRNVADFEATAHL
jgi:predicted nucleic acid-binding protein